MLKDNDGNIDNAIIYIKNNTEIINNLYLTIIEEKSQKKKDEKEKKIDDVEVLTSILEEELTNTKKNTNKKITAEFENDVKIKKKSVIPKKIKQLVWNKYIGEDKGKSKCLCCKHTEISQMDFHCGHIISEFNGGKITIDNLKPICSLCNSSMGKTNMNEFIQTHGLDK